MNRTWRLIAGVLVLALLAGVTGMLVPPYLRNYKFQRYLDELVEQKGSPEVIQATVVDRAARMGLPVRAGDVRVARSKNGVRVDIVYVVRVDVPLYTVDLHFHPSSTTD